MKVLLHTTVIWYGCEYHAGDVADLPTDVAEAFIRTNQAEAAEEVESATLGTDQHENTMRHYKPRRR